MALRFKGAGVDCTQLFFFHLPRLVDAPVLGESADIWALTISLALCVAVILPRACRIRSFGNYLLGESNSGGLPLFFLGNIKPLLSTMTTDVAHFLGKLNLMVCTEIGFPWVWAAAKLGFSFLLLLFVCFSCNKSISISMFSFHVIF